MKKLIVLFVGTLALSGAVMADSCGAGEAKDKASCEMKKAECSAEKASCEIKKAECSTEAVACEMKKAECAKDKTACEMKKSECATKGSKWNPLNWFK